MGTAAKSTRVNRTITVDFQDETTYVQLLGDGRAFVECVLAFLLALGFQLIHKATCRPGGSEGRNFGQVASDVPLVSCNCLIFLSRVDDHTSCYSTSSDVGEGHAGGGEHPSQRQLRGLFEGQSGVHVQREGAIGIHMSPQ